MQSGGVENVIDRVVLAGSSLLIQVSLTKAHLKAFMVSSDQPTVIYARQAAASGKAIEGSLNTNLSPLEIRITAHGYSVGQLLYISGIPGLPNVTGWLFVASVPDADHFTVSAYSLGAMIESGGNPSIPGGLAQTGYILIVPPRLMRVWSLTRDGIGALPFDDDIDALQFFNRSDKYATVRIRALST